MSAIAPRCPKCGAAVSGRASEGLCPRCLLRGALEWREVEMPAEDSALDLPREFGEYELLECIAEGGMGVVYRARHTALGREVALKMIRVGPHAGAEEVRRFISEARAAARLDHPGIVPIYETGEHEGVHFFTMKLVKGGSLSGKREDQRDAARIVAAVARAVHHAHQRGILHRDLKPSNVLLDGSQPLVADFGIARLAQGGADLTLSGALVGTPAYMAPEQAAGTAFTTASDVYSLGAMLFALLTGKPPFGVGVGYEVIRRVVEEEAVQPSAVAPGIHRDLDAITLRCLEKDPGRRFKSAAALAEDLERWLRGEPVRSRRASAAERIGKWARRRPAWAALAGVTFAGVTAFVALMLASDSRLRAQRNYAQGQEKLARNEAARAAEARTRAEQNELTARLRLYAADVFLASSALADGNYGLARTALETHIPVDGATDLRGFEWFHLMQRCQGDPSRALPGHKETVTALAFTHDSRVLASSGREGRVLIRELAKDDSVLQIPRPPQQTRTVAEHMMMSPVFAVSPEARDILTAEPKRYAELMMRGRPSSVGDVRVLAVSKDGEWLATGAQWNFVRVWRTNQGVLSWILPVHNCRGLAFTPDGSLLVVGEGGSGNGEGWVRAYDTGTHKHLWEAAPAHGVLGLTADGASVVLMLSNGVIETRDAKTGVSKNRLNANAAFHALAVSGDGALAATIGHELGNAEIWSLTENRSVGRVNHGARVWALAFSPDGRTLATAGADHAVKFWDARTLAPRRVFRGHGDEILSLAFSPDGAWLASGSRDSDVRLWHLADTPAQAKLVPSVVPAGIANGCVVEDARGSVHAWALDDPQPRTLPGPGERKTIGMKPDGTGFYTVSADGATVQEWKADATPAAPAVHLEPRPISMRAAAAGGGVVAVAAERVPVAIYDLRSGKKLQSLGPERPDFSKLRLSPDGTLLAAFQWPRRVHLFDITDGRHITELQSDTGDFSVFAFSADSRLLAAGGSDNTVTVLDARTGRRVAGLRGHKSEIKAIAFSPDGLTLASSGSGGALRLWHAATWRELATLAEGKVFQFLAFDRGELLAHDGSALHRFTAPGWKGGADPGK